jgi:hypothetical protein
MAKKKLTPQQQRDRRAKIMLAVLGVVFIGVLGIQLPKLLHSGGSTTPPVAAPPTTSTPAAGAATFASASAPSHLVQFTRFPAKDPFRQQNTAAGAATTATTTTAAPKPRVKPLTISVTQTAQLRVPAALLQINGKRRVVALDAGFPTKNPLFRIVALSGKAIWIQLVGGSLASGQRTLKIQAGQPVTLADTTAGLKVALSLVKLTTAPKSSGR